MQHDDLSKKTPQEIRTQMAQTRHALTTKAEALQSEVQRQVTDAKELVQERIEKVKMGFNLSHQVGKRPWQAMASAVAVGVILRGIVGNRETELKRRRVSSLFSGTLERNNENFRSRDLQPPAQHGRSIVESLAQEFGNEFRQARNIAIGSGLGLFREFAKKSLPPAVSSHIDNFVTGTSGRRDAKQDTTRRDSYRTVNG